jgi:hypothetical protein
MFFGWLGLLVIKNDVAPVLTGPAQDGKQLA